MVGYYSEATLLPTAQVRTSIEETGAVKKLVCSPDFALADLPKQADPETIRCQVCDKMYTSKAAFASHARSHTKETEDPYRCDICSKTFAVPARLTRHYRTHTGEKPFKCEFCSKSFSVKENLSVHRRIHTKERPYKCEVCSRAFEHSGKLHRHMRIHTGERPHKCSVCLKTFIQSGQLVIHMRTHTGEKPYVCTVCQKGFTCSKQLKVHSRTHTGEKPYSCEICGKSFGYNHVLKLHQVAHYGEKVYKCTICNDTFNSKKSMEAHIKSHSDNVPPAQPPTPPASSESSCSSGSDAETFKDPPPPPLAPEPAYDPDVRYVVYAPPAGNYATGVELLAAAATTVTERDEIYRSTQDVLNLIKNGPACLRRHPAYFTAPAVQYAPLTAGDGLRRRVEAVLAAEEPGARPPSPPASPDPELSLPPRKRSRMILKSMETSGGGGVDLSPVRYSSVIHYAKAS